MLVSTYMTVQCHNPEDHILNTHYFQYIYYQLANFVLKYVDILILIVAGFGVVVVYISSLVMVFVN